MTTVLLVDNNSKNLKETLEYYDFEVTACKNLAEALKLIECEQFDIILLDVIMPNISGFEILKEIRNISNLPIIITTSLKDEDKMIEGLKNGADDYLIKPFSVQNLLARMDAVLRRTNHKNTNKTENGVTKKLTKREVEALKLVALGDDNKQIGQKLFLSEVTIKSHMNSIFKKLKVKNRTQAVLLYNQN